MYPKEKREPEQLRFRSNEHIADCHHSFHVKSKSWTLGGSKGGVSRQIKLCSVLCFRSVWKAGWFAHFLKFLLHKATIFLMILLFLERLCWSTLFLDSVLPVLRPLYRHPPSLPPPIVSGLWLPSWSKVYLRILGQLDFKINVLVMHALCERFSIWSISHQRRVRYLFTLTLWEMLYQLL